MKTLVTSLFLSAALVLSAGAAQKKENPAPNCQHKEVVTNKKETMKPKPAKKETMAPFRGGQNTRNIPL